MFMQRRQNRYIALACNKLSHLNHLKMAAPGAADNNCCNRVQVRPILDLYYIVSHRLICNLVSFLSWQQMDMFIEQLIKNFGKYYFESNFQIRTAIDRLVGIYCYLSYLSIVSIIIFIQKFLQIISSAWFRKMAMYLTNRIT